MNHTWAQPVKHQIALQDRDGTTKRAIELLMRNGSKLQTLAYVELCMPRGRDWAETEARFIDTQGNYIQVDGFAWGYSGEGPHGLFAAFKMFRLPFEMGLIASWSFEHAVIDAQSLLVHNCQCAEVTK